MVESNNNVDWEEQEQEIESLQYIFPEELTIRSEKPYAIDIVLNSNTESEEKNFLKLTISFTLQEKYPEVVPYFKVKNHSPDYIDNAVLDQYEEETREVGVENLGSMMIFQMCDYLKEKITDINDKVLEKLEKIEREESAAAGLETGEVIDMTKLDFTPVNAETFGAWCKIYKERLLAERYARVGDIDSKMTGKELFLQNKNVFDDLTLDEEIGEEEDEDDTVDNEEEKKEDSDEEVVDFTYDRALYDAGEDEEDVDFDDDDE